MQTTSALWRQMAASNTALLRTKATIGGVDYTDMAPPVVRRALMDDAVSIGNCVAAALTLELKTANSVAENIPRSAQVLLTMWWEDESGQTSEALPVGTFYVSRRQYVNRTQRMTLECYDAMLKANAPISEAGISTWPAQIGSVVTAIATAMGVTVDSRTYYRSATLTIPEPAEGATLRDVLSGIAALHGGNWYITPEGKLRLKWIYHQGPTDLVEYEDHPEWNTSDEVSVRGVTGAMLYDVIPGEGGSRYTFTGLRVIDDAGEQMRGNWNGAVVTLRSNWADSGWISWLWGRMHGEYWWPVTIDGAIYDPAAELGDWLKSEIWFEENGQAAFTDGYCMLCMETVTLGPAPRANVSMPAPGETEDEYPYISSAEQEAMQTRTRLDALEDRLDNLTPAAIGAVNKAGDIMTGTLAVRNALYLRGDTNPAIYFYDQAGTEVQAGIYLLSGTNQLLLRSYHTGESYYDNFNLPVPDDTGADQNYRILTTKEVPVFSVIPLSNLRTDYLASVGGGYVKSGRTVTFSAAFTLSAAIQSSLAGCIGGLPEPLYPVKCLVVKDSSADANVDRLAFVESNGTLTIKGAFATGSIYYISGSYISSD